jgi:hypothetical protein
VGFASLLLYDRCGVFVLLSWTKKVMGWVCK